MREGASANPLILGGAQTDFARNWTREGKSLFELMGAAVRGALQDAAVDPGDVGVAHVGNFTGELFCGQGHLGGMFAALDPAFSGVPASRHEAACASGSMAVLAATADLESGRYDLACVVGVELMKNVDGATAAKHLGAALWAGAEATDARYPWPRQFSDIADEYDRRYGLRREHLARLAELNFANARKNPNAQTRGWTLGPENFAQDDAANPLVEGRLRKHDCGQLTDGAACLLLASPRYAEAWAARTGRPRGSLSEIRGWGHRTSTLKLADKLAAAPADGYLFPNVRRAITDAYARAGVAGPEAIDAVETHDCFTITEYLAIDHFGVTPPGQAWRAIEDGVIEPGGRLPFNPSGGLIGAGHPVGATGVRMLVDAHRQVTGTAGDCQVEGARTVATLNLGGSATTAAAFVVGRATCAL